MSIVVTLWDPMKWLLYREVASLYSETCQKWSPSGWDREVAWQIKILVHCILEVLSIPFNPLDCLDTTTPGGKNEAPDSHLSTAR